MLYSITSNNLHIINSFDYRKDEMLSTLLKICFLHANSQVWKRSFDSLENEWCVHNALYRLHILRSRTVDVNLNFPNRIEWLYNLLAPLARLIIK